MSNKYTVKYKFFDFIKDERVAAFVARFNSERLWHETAAEQCRFARASLKDVEGYEDAFFLYALAEAVTWYSKPKGAPERSRGRQLPEKLRQREKYEADRAKLKAFDRIVEMLDHMLVEGKILGDCTRGDLLRAAVHAETAAGEMVLTAALYRELAELVGGGTVREASNRGKVVALLTSRFDEAA